MIQPKIQEVYVTTTIVHKLGHDYLGYAKKIVFPETLITFTPEEFEQFKREFGKELLEKAAENAKLESREYKPYRGEILKTEDMGQEVNLEERIYLGINKESITGVLDKFLENNKI